MKKKGLRRFRSTFGDTFEQLECKRLLAADVMIGDSDGNGMFGSEDLVQVFQAGKFESGRSASFAEGDWNNDGVFNTSDIVHAMQRGRFGQRVLQADEATPEAERPDGVEGRRQGGRLLPSRCRSRSGQCAEQSGCLLRERARGGTKFH